MHHYGQFASISIVAWGGITGAEYKRRFERARYSKIRARILRVSLDLLSARCKNRWHQQELDIQTA